MNRLGELDLAAMSAKLEAMRRGYRRSVYAFAFFVVVMLSLVLCCSEWPVVFIGGSLVAFVPGAILRFRVAQSVCPRCGERYFQALYGVYYPDSRRCRHCRLPIEASLDDLRAMQDCEDERGSSADC